MLSEAKLAQILNRPLTTNESGNYARAAAVAAGHLSLLLCGSVERELGAERTYEVRQGYRTVFTDPFTGVATVTVDDSETPAEADTYTLRLGDRIVSGEGLRNAVVFKKHLARTAETITVTADWGWDDATMPADVATMFADLFVKAVNGSTTLGQRKIKSKRIDDYSVTYEDESLDGFTEQYGAVIAKYSNCGSGAIRHGTVRPVFYR